MSPFLAIGLVAIGLIGVAAVILTFDIARGDVGGGRHTLERARRLLVVATDAETLVAAERWVEEQREQHPELRCFVLRHEGHRGLLKRTQEAIARENPDAIVVMRHEDSEDPEALKRAYESLKEDLSVPVDAVYVGRAAAG